MNIQGWFPLGLIGLILRLRDSQESSTPQFESISSSALSLLYGPAVTSVHDHWKNCNFDYMDFCRQSDVHFLIRCLGHPSEKAMAPHSSTLAWKIPWLEEPGRLQSMESLRVGHDWATSLLLFTFMHWRRKWQPTPVFLPGESQGRGNLWAAIYGLTQSRTWLKRLSSSMKRKIRSMDIMWTEQQEILYILLNLSTSLWVILNLSGRFLS